MSLSRKSNRRADRVPAFGWSFLWRNGHHGSRRRSQGSGLSLRRGLRSSRRADDRGAECRVSPNPRVEQKFSHYLEACSTSPKRGVSEDFAPDLPTIEQRAVFASQIPLAAASFQVKLSSAAWTTKPSWYIVATHDQIINPDLERSLAMRIGATRRKYHRATS